MDERVDVNRNAKGDSGGRPRAEACDALRPLSAPEFPTYC
jgi:hypothetical protein